MRQKFSIGLLMLSLIMALGAIGLTACSNDDTNDLEDDVYKGYIKGVYGDTNNDGSFTIKITHSPDESENGKPLKNQSISFLLYKSDAADD